MTAADRLRRSSTDRMLCGVSGGLAEYFDVDPTLVRLGWVVLCFVTAGAAVVAYFVLCLVIPNEETPAAGPSWRGRRQPSPPTKVRDVAGLEEEARVYLKVRRELGPEYEDALADSFVHRVDESLKSRRSGASGRGSAESHRGNRGQKYLAVLLIAVGATVLLAEISWGVALPVATIGVGAVLLTRRKPR